MKYSINEIFYSIQGEGMNAGRPAIFVRFSGCNLKCVLAEQGFDCDTNFERGSLMTLESIEDAAWREFGGQPGSDPAWPNGLLMVLTGGEPSLQLDRHFLSYFQSRGFEVAIETNGTRPLPEGLNWICVSPKRGTEIVVRFADEVKYVLAAGQEPWNVPNLGSTWQLISPAFKGLQPDDEAIKWCLEYVKRNPQYRLSIQLHKIIGVR
jgi:organic radical activating enzyme